MVIPNLYVAAHHLVHPHYWFSKRQQSKDSVAVPGQPLAVTEHWNSPVPGVYRYRPGGGWFLMQLDSDPSKPEAPVRVVFCAPLNRRILESDYIARSRKATLPKDAAPALSRTSSRSSKRSSKASPATSRSSSYLEAVDPPKVSFVRHDDGFAWLNDKDVDGTPTKGPWQRFCIDKATGEMRPMLKRDDPAWRERRLKPSSHQQTVNENARPNVGRGSSSDKSVASRIRAVAPELDHSAQTASFLGPRSLHGSARASARASPIGSPSASRRNSIDMMPERATRKSPLGSPELLPPE